MAYSDYGGYAYKNGYRVEDRSDAVISADKANHGIPGVYPGFAAIANGQSVEDFQKLRESSVDGHVVLGDGPVFVSLYKQSTLRIYILEDGAFRRVPLHEIAVGLPDKYVTEWGFDSYQAAEDGLGVIRCELDAFVIEALFEESDNFYQYVRLTQPDGNVWTGFSGYGVGAGLEDCGYGYSTDNCIYRLTEIF